MKPDLVIQRKSDGVNYLKRWYLIPRNRFFNIYLHKFEGSDDDRAYHDHPWWSVSFKLWGDHLIELIEDPDSLEIYESGHAFSQGVYKYIMPLVPYFRPAKQMHRMILEGNNAWTLFITGPWSRHWGFRVQPKDGGNEEAWMHHTEFFTKYGD